MQCSIMSCVKTLHTIVDGYLAVSDVVLIKDKIQVSLTCTCSVMCHSVNTSGLNYFE